MQHQIRHEQYDTVVREEFAAQRFMQTLGASLARVEPGIVEIAVPFDEAHTQQDGFLHAGVTTTIVDSACGFAALTLMAAGDRVLTVDLSINLLAPARDGLLARGEVVRSGGTITVCRGEVRHGDADGELVAICQATMARRPGS
jgi:uncharacterized protein (TIGR00369 family)